MSKASISWGTDVGNTSSLRQLNRRKKTMLDGFVEAVTHTFSQADVSYYQHPAVLSSRQLIQILIDIRQKTFESMRARQNRVVAKIAGKRYTCRYHSYMQIKVSRHAEDTVKCLSSGRVWHFASERYVPSALSTSSHPMQASRMS